MPSAPSDAMSEAEQIACWINKVARAMSTASARVVTAHQLSGSQAKLLLRLKQGMDSPSAIARCVGFEASNMSRLIRTLEARNLVLREVDDNDRSRAIISLTKDGHRMAESIRPLTKRLEEEIIGSLSMEDRKTLIESLKKLSQTLNEGIDGDASPKNA